MFKLELVLNLFLIFLLTMLVVTLEFNLFFFLIFSLLYIISGILLYQSYMRKNILNSIYNQAQEILKGNIKHRILLKNKGRYSYLALIFNEITEKLQSQVVKNKTAEDSRKRLLSNISHDIRTPLTSILGYVEALKNDLSLDHEERNKYLNILINKSRNLKSLIDEIFQMARLDANDFELDYVIFDLAEITRECLIDFLPEIKRKNFNTEINIPDKDCLIYGDRLSVERIIKNVLKNSIQHGKDGKFIGVKLVAIKRDFILYISDKGSGIKKEDIPYIFERLYTGDKTRNRSLAGSGLGLSIAQKLLEKHGGKISLESVEGEKTTFKLIFPGI